MQYDVTHTTEYDYSESVVVAHHAARLKPRELPQQECLQPRARDRACAGRDEHV